MLLAWVLSLLNRFRRLRRNGRFRATRGVRRLPDQFTLGQRRVILDWSTRQPLARRPASLALSDHVDRFPRVNDERFRAVRGCPTRPAPSMR